MVPFSVQTITNKKKPYAFYLFFAWTVFIIFSLSLTIRNLQEAVLEQAAIEARTHLELNLEYRALISKLGGVYASLDNISPNPYLKVPKRDITTKDGDRLTLLNPAYMTRLIFETIKNKSSLPVINKITSLKIVNPVNAPDEWERKMLLAFEKGQKEAREITSISGGPYLRLMRPFFTETSCLKCHGYQGYEEGDVRGAISIAVPLKPYYVLAARTRNISVITYILLWLVGCVGLVIFSRFKQKQEQKLIESEWKFRTVSESANDWEYWLSEDRQIVYMSPSSEKITGYNAQEFMNNPDLVTDIVHPEDRPLFVNHIENPKNTSHEETEFRIVSKSGQIKWLAHICAPLHMQQKFLGRRISNRDITERKKTEDELRKYRESLEELVEKRTEELKEISEELRRSNNELQQFAYAASHDLQEPLRTIAGFAKMIEKRYKSRLDEKADEFIGFIIDGTKRMQQLIKDLLEYSRVGAKHNEFKPTDCSLIIDKVISNLETSIKENSATVTYENLPTIMSDADQLGRLFQNLISNAIKFRSTETPKIHIAAGKKKDEWVFSVRDNGIGIDPKYSEKIFVVFQRMHTTSEYPGTGIGLAICKKIVEHHGGRIWVESEPEKGATFYFTLPVLKESVKD